MISLKRKLDSSCDTALAQISKNQYAIEIKKSGYKQVLSIGIAFYKNQCLVKVASE